MYPISSAPFHMAMNKKMLEDAGLQTLLKKGWTTDDFEKVLKAFKDKGYTRFIVPVLVGGETKEHVPSSPTLWRLCNRQRSN